MGYYDLDASGILPNDYGNFEAQREWSKKMDSVVYKAAPVAITTQLHATTSSVVSFTVQSLGSRLTLCTNEPGTATFFTTNGQIIEIVSILKSGTVTTRVGALGCYLVKFTSAGGMVAKRIVNY
jgi:hypothetical protein